MGTEERARNWLSVIGITATAILEPFTTTMIVTTGRLLSITELANATATLVVTIAGNARFGYHGINCTEKKTLTRKNFLKLSAEEKDRYMRYINQSKYFASDYVVTTEFYDDIGKTVKAGKDPSALFHNVTNYDLFTWMHYYAARDTLIPNDNKADIDFAHDGQGFPTWHRLYLLAWERTLQGENTFRFN